MSTESTRRIFLGAVTAAAAVSSAAAEDKEKVTGIGGFFFRAKDPKGMAKWYSDHLGVDVTPMKAGDQPWHQEAGTCAFQPFSETSGYLGDSAHRWMINFRVRSLEKMAAQLRAAGISVDVDPQTYPNGVFAHLTDPEGNKVELWEPRGADR